MRLRFHLRTLLAAVAVAGVVLGAAVWGQRLRERSRSYRQHAALHELSRKIAALYTTLSIRTAEQKAVSKKSAAWHAARRDEYLEAARFPWRNLPFVYRPPWEPPLIVPKYASAAEAKRAAYADQMALMKDHNPALYAERVAKYGPPGPPSAKTAALVKQLRKTRAWRPPPRAARKPTRPTATEGGLDDPEGG